MQLSGVRRIHCFSASPPPVSGAPQGLVLGPLLVDSSYGNGLAGKGWRQGVPLTSESVGDYSSAVGSKLATGAALPRVEGLCSGSEFQRDVCV